MPKLRRALLSTAPGTKAERALWNTGANTIVGFDEVGKGAWAGPLTVGAVVIPRDQRLYKVRDSKQLTEREREGMVERIKEWSLGWAVGHATPKECDELGMSDAQRLATQRAIVGLDIDVDHALADGAWDFVETMPTTTIIKGDTSSISIAAASIIAKVTRDRIMRGAAESYPWYAFDSNKGYPCHRHRGALRVVGPSTIHRRSWAFMQDLGWDGIPECRGVEDQPTLF